MQSKLLICILCIILTGVESIAQDKLNVKFGNVAANDFSTKIYPIDSSANAVVIADIGSSEIEGNRKGWFSLVHKHYKRVHILNKNGYDIANVEIHLYTDGSSEELLDKLKAITYNLENGKVVETKLDVKSNVFKDKINKNLIVKKFTFPNVKEGSIIEYEYTVTSDFLQNLQPWEFQGAYPRLWSEYDLSLPEFLGYVFLSQGDRTYDINNSPKQRSEVYRIIDSRGAGANETYQLTANVSDYRWVKKNVKALKEESYTSTINNHISKLEFQLSEYRQPLTYHRVMGTWEKLAEDLLNADYFGLQISKDNGWLKDIVKPLLDGAGSPLDKAKKIYGYVRDNFTCTNYNRFTVDQNLKTTVKNKSGSVAEINLLLTAMLKYSDINADPVILSTRSNGYTYSLYPLLSQYNYVIVMANIDNNIYYMDASEPRMGFGHLPVRCYNGQARVINKTAPAIELNNESLVESKFTSIFMINDEKGKMVGTMQQTPGYYESLNIRDRVKEKGKDQLQKDIIKAFGISMDMSNFVLDSLDKPEDLLNIKYDFDINEEKTDIIYFNPMLGEGTKENPFKSAERLYPVEMPYAFDENYHLQMEVPVGYEVDELPKSVVVKLNEQEEGFFEYRISQSGNRISFRSRIKFTRTFFQPEEYQMLREFFNLVVKKHAEQIVFKKVNN